MTSKLETLSTKELIKHWSAVQKDKQDHPDLYKLRSTGLKGLDHILGGGVEYGNMVIYGGEQKIGKSTLLQRTAESMGEQEEPFLYLSGEMTNTAMATRLVCSVSGVDKNKVRRMELDASDWKKIKQAETKISKYNGWWSYGFSTIKHVQQIIDEIEKDTNVTIRVILVDYIQLMEHPGYRQRNEELEALSHAFKRMTITTGSPRLIFLAAQLNRQSIRNHVVDANSFLGTGALERDMDVGVIMTHAKDEAGNVLDNYRELIVVGSRETAVDKCRVRFNGSTSTIADMDVPLPVIDLDYWK